MIMKYHKIIHHSIYFVWNIYLKNTNLYFIITVFYFQAETFVMQGSDIA